MSIYQNTINYRPGAVPKLNTPGNGSILTSHYAYLDWGGVMATVHYVEVRRGSTTGSIAASGTVASTGGWVSALPSGLYYWRVKAYNGSAWSAWPGWWKFRIN